VGDVVRSPPGATLVGARRIMRSVCGSLAKMHYNGIIHRDVKPSNVLITAGGGVKFIDLGAATDLRVGINFNPLTGMLDPEYAPPEQLVRIRPSVLRGRQCVSTYVQRLPPASTLFVQGFFSSAAGATVWSSSGEESHLFHLLLLLRCVPRPTGGNVAWLGDAQVVPESTPRAPPPPIAIALSPLFFAVTAPALFDSYSVGVLLLQLLVPELRTFQGLRAFKRELEVRPPRRAPD
jgi:serine/threonine protein kinase